MFYSRLCTCSNPHVDRCSNPLPWDPLSSPQIHARALCAVRNMSIVWSVSASALGLCRRTREELPRGRDRRLEEKTMSKGETLV